jgi:hypothetical protein
MSDNSSLLLILTLLLLFGGLGYGGSILFGQLQAATIAATARPSGTDEGPGGIYVAPEPADPTGELMWLRVFLNTFELVLDALSSRMSDIAERRLNDFDDEQNRRRLDDGSENRARNAADGEDGRRAPSAADDPASRTPVDDNPENRIKNASDVEDRRRAPSAADDPASRTPVDSENRIRNAADAEDTRRFSSATEDPASRTPVDGNTEIKNAVNGEDSRRAPSAADDPASRTPIDSNPESRIKNAAGAEDSRRAPSATDDPASRAPVDSENRIRNAADAEDSRRAPSAADDPASRTPVNGNTEIKNAVNGEDIRRAPSATEDPASRTPIDDNPDNRIKNASDVEDRRRAPSATEDPASRTPVDDNPENRIKNASDVEDTRRAPSAADNPESRTPADPESGIRNASDVEDKRLAPSATDDPESRTPVDNNPENRITNVAAAEDRRRAPLAADNPESRVPLNPDSKINAVVNRLDIKGESVITKRKNMFKRLAAATTISAEIVEGRVFGPDGRVRPLSENISEIKYDSKAAGAFGTGPSPAVRQTPKGREIIAMELSRTEIAARATPRGAMIKGAALRAASLAAEAVGAVGDVMDVLQIIQVFGNAMYYDPGCEANPGNPTLCKFPTEFLTANQAKDISKLVVKKQIDLLAAYKPKSDDFKPQFPLIRGPLDILSDDPYQNQTLIQLEVDAVQNRILNGDPWRTKFVTYFGSQTVLDEIVNDQEDGLSYYTSKVGMTNQEIDSVYETAFTAVCLQNNGKVWKDTYTSGRPRFQCGFTAAGCDTARRQYFSPSGKGNYVEWYTYTDINTLLSSLTITPPVVVNFMSKPSDEDGFCMVSSPGTAGLCNYYKGEYDVSTHSCQFTPAYCQSIGACHESTSNVCYLPGPEMEALNFFFAGGGVREWIKVNGCTFVGSPADKTRYAAESTIYTFMPIAMLFTRNGRRMFQDAIANAKNWGPGIKAQLNDPMVGVSFAGAVVGLATMAAAGAATAGLLTGATAAAATGIGLPVAGLIILATGITLAVTMVEAQEAKDSTAQVDKEDFAFQGLQKVVISTTTADVTAGTYYIPTSRGYAAGWVTRKLPVTKRANGTLCTAVENYRNPTTCYEVASTADNPHVYQTDFALKVYKKGNFDDAAKAFFTQTLGTDPSQIETSEFDYGKKTQCWKYDYNVKKSDGTTTIQNFQTGVSGVNPSSYGQPYGTIETTMHDKIFDGLIRAGTSGSTDKTWCMKRRPDAVMFDATIGTPAAESEYSMNRSWTSKMGDAGLYYPEYPTEAAVLSAELHNHFRYQLVYAKDSIPQTTMWDNLLMEAIFTDSTIAEIRRYYCEQELVKYSSDTAQINKKCYGYLSLGLPGYTWFPMSLPGKVLSSFNTTRGTVTMGVPTQGNRDTVCAIKYGANFEEDSKGLCYLNCNYGTGATSDTYAYISREWKSDSSSFCYKQYPKWEDNGRGHGEQTITKKIFTSTWQGVPNSCPADKEKGGSGSLCYKKCSSLTPNLDTTKYEYLNDGSTQCYKHDLVWETEASRKGRPAGTGSRTYSTMNKPLAFAAVRKGLKTAGVCPANYENVAGICYPNCRSDQTAVGPTCYDKNCPSGTTERTYGLCTNNCDSGYSWDESACYKNCNSGYYRSSLGFCQQSCGPINYQGLTAQTKQITAGICSAYNFSCPSSYDKVGDGISTPTCYRPLASRARTQSCPSGYKFLGASCEKQTYNIGVGTDKECQRTSRGYCHATRPWVCGGGVREEVDLMCYNPCQPAFNSGITCPAGATNNGGYCEKPIPQWTPPPLPSWWRDGIQCPQACGGGYTICFDQQVNGRYVTECAWRTSYQFDDGDMIEVPVWDCWDSYVYDGYKNVCVSEPVTCVDVANPSTDYDPRYYATLAEWCASTTE